MLALCRATVVLYIYNLLFFQNLVEKHGAAESISVICPKKEEQRYLSFYGHRLGRSHGWLGKAEAGFFSLFPGVVRDSVTVDVDLTSYVA